jgi:hypothetical protein
MSRGIRVITALFLWMGFITVAATAASADTPVTTSRQWDQVTTISTVSPAPTRDSSVTPLAGVACWKWSPYAAAKNRLGCTALEVPEQLVMVHLQFEDIRYAEVVPQRRDALWVDL